MKVVVDTNVLLVSIPKISKYRPIFDGLLKRKYNLAISESILQEYLEISGRCVLVLHQTKTMIKFYTILLAAVICSLTLSAQKTKVLTLGTFHFGFPNKDVQKIEDSDQIDVLKPEHQKEIKEIVKRIAEFKPTIIAIEVGPDNQRKIDSVYRAYLNGTYELSRNETMQLGFRLAKQFNLSTLHCVDDSGRFYADVDSVLSGKDAMARQEFMDYFYNNPDSSLIYESGYIFKTEGILKELQRLNSEEEIRKDLGNYMISIFKYETTDNEYFGVDFTSGWWFNRNLRILRNIQKIPTKPEDRILVIFGAGHMNLLNIFFDASPEYELERVNDYLK